MSLSGIKMRITRDNITILDKMREKHIFCSTTLMSGNHILKPGDTGYCILKFIE